MDGIEEQLNGGKEKAIKTDGYGIDDYW